MSFNPEKAEFIREVWSMQRVPVRPSAEGLNLYRAEMEKLPRKRALVLGATPELVDMALELNAERIVSIELNPDILEAMRRLGERDWGMVEMIAGNWLEDRPDFVGSFDCIVCDGGLLFLQYPGQWERLFELVYSYLAPGGIFVAKEWAEPPGERDYKNLSESLIAEFVEKSRGLERQAMLEMYMNYVDQIALASMVEATRPDCSFDQQLMTDRHNAMAERLCRMFPDPEMVKISRSTMLYVARSSDNILAIVAGVRFDGADQLLSAQGFQSDYYPLPDPPVPDGNYMFVARKKL